MSRITSAVFVKSSSKHQECPKDDRPEYAFIGRSNVGKSSLINLLTYKKNLAKVSSKPGKTQLINHFNINDEWYLVDLPGYGWAKVSKTEKARWKRMIEEYILQRKNMVNLFLLIDSRHEPQKNDLDFMNWLGVSEIPFALVFTKVDKLSKNKVQSNMAKYKKVLSRNWEELPPSFRSSTVTGEGVDELLDYIADINKQVGIPNFNNQ